MTSNSLNKENWSDFFALISKLTRGRQIQLELVGDGIGDQIEVDWSLFEDSYFDESSDTLYLRTASIEHQIPRPQLIEIQEDNLLRAIGIWDADGILQILHFRDQVLLESPATH